MSEESKEDRFYEPRNWDKKMVIEDPDTGVKRFCGKCGHGIYDGDRFCTKCGTEARQ